MAIEGVGMTTLLALIATRGQVIDRGAYLVALTPEDPGYHHGTFIVLPRAPRSGELAWALALFAREVAALPEVRHVTLYWRADTPEPSHDELIAAGFDVEVGVIMTGGVPRPAAPPPGIELRRLAPDEPARVAELLFGAGERHDEAYRQFLRRRAAWQRDLVVRGLAGFWGAFDDRTLVASLGMVRLGRLGRYQDVQTVASHRRTGIAAALLWAAGREAIAAGAEQLVILTVSGSDGERVYARAGFRPIERIVTACRRPP
jgi:GNAT superfamily N-acetyltransferase